MTKPLCVMQAPFFIRSGYSGWAEAIGKSLIRYGKYELILAPTIWGACSKKNMESELNDPETKELLGRIMKGPLNKQPEVFIQMTIPSEFQIPGKFNIGMTAGIESTVPAGSWIEKMNQMQLNVVLSKFNKDVFEKTVYTKRAPNGTLEELKCRTPVEVSFWGADTKTFHKTSETNFEVNDVLKDIPEEFAFLFVGQWTNGNIRADRKSIGYLIHTFLETFANVNNPPCLILKTNGAQICVMDRHDCVSKLNEITSMIKNKLGQNVKLPNVYLLHGELNDTEMNALFNHNKVKMHVSFTHGEGFGHPLLLATLSGKPLLSSKWSGHLDFLNPSYTDFFEGNLVPIPGEALNDWFIKDARWFDVDYTEAGKKMKYYFNNYDNRILERSEKLREENMEKFSLVAMDKVFHSILDKYVPEFPTQAPLVLPKLKKLNIPTLPSGATPLNLNDGNKTTTPTTLTANS